jgi:hypothetical protein
MAVDILRCRKYNPRVHLGKRHFLHEIIPTQRAAKAVDESEIKHYSQLDGSFRGYGLGLGMGSVCLKQLEIPGSAGIHGKPKRFGCGSFLFF